MTSMLPCQYQVDFAGGVSVISLPRGFVYVIITPVYSANDRNSRFVLNSMRYPIANLPPQSSFVRDRRLMTWLWFGLAEFERNLLPQLPPPTLNQTLFTFRRDRVPSRSEPFTGVCQKFCVFGVI